MSNNCNCPALIISAPSSGSGKTTITAAIATYHRLQGKDVRVFKTGPDFIDPMILTKASGNPVYQLDLWMVGEQNCRELLFEAAQQADLILIEGVMGLFDGDPSTADLSLFFDIPVLAIIDGSAMAQTFGALALGLQQYKPELKFAGVIANRIASERHAEMIRDSVPKSIGFFDVFMRDNEVSLPERHLGLVQADELHDIDEKLQKAASKIANTSLSELPEVVHFSCPETTNTYRDYPLAGKRIIIAKDLAFNFLYQANLRLLKQLGAELVFTSPMHDSCLPDGDALYFPGGYPELYASQLSENHNFISSVKHFALQDKPLLAECGGMLYLLDQLTVLEENNKEKTYNMAGVLSGNGEMKKKLSAIGQQYADFVNYSSIQDPTTQNKTDKQQVRGHSFHYSTANVEVKPVIHAQYYSRNVQGEAIYLQNNFLASYMHWYFPSNVGFFTDFFLNKPIK
ncbi:MAG: cobyrinic acid a,c-diamide synthase [Colwellia sp.]|jgi:cobyrinic acid a,c-diamide synthase